MDEVDPSWLVELAALGLLFLYLGWRLDGATRLALRRQKASEKEWAHKAFDADSISPQIQQVRRDYVRVVRSRPCFPYGRRERVAKVRCAVGRLAFFQRLGWGTTSPANQQSSRVAESARSDG